MHHDEHSDHEPDEEGYDDPQDIHAGGVMDNAYSETLKLYPVYSGIYEKQPARFGSTERQDSQR